MFERQWFHPFSQLSLANNSKEFEELLIKSSYAEAIAHAKIASTKEKNKRISNRFWKRQIKRALWKEKNEASKIVKVKFIDFWKGFEPERNEMLNLMQRTFKKRGLKLEVKQSGETDVEIYSCFGQSSLTNKINGACRILYIGENVRPQFTDYDYSISHDIYDYNKRNVYIPLWFTRLQENATSQKDYEPYLISQLTQPREPIKKNKNVIYIGNNMTPLRASIICYLENNGYKVDIFGSHTRPIENKRAKMNEYTYSLCIENGYSEGYVTEKLFDGYVSNTIPIYWGGINENLLNSEAFIWLKKEDELSMITKEIESREINYYQDKILVEESKLERFKEKINNDLVELSYAFR